MDRKYIFGLMIGRMPVRAAAVVAAMAVAVMMGGCDEETMAGGGEVPEKQLDVTFNIGTPEGGEVIYTRAAEAGNDKRIESLRVYDFRVHTDGENGGKRVLFSNVHRLKKVSGSPKAGEFMTEYNSTTDAVTATLTLSLRGTGNTAIDPPHVFVFVANEEAIHFDSIMKPGVTPIDSLLYCYSARRLKDGESCDKLIDDRGAVMTAVTGEVSISADGTAAPAELPKLCRMVARIDVVHNVTDERNLKVLGISARNCTSRGYLFGSNYAGTATMEEYDYDTGIASVGMNSGKQEALEGLTANATCESVLYLYEQPAKQGTGDTPAPELLLTYTLSGAVNTLPVPMEIKSGSASERISVTRNNKYRLVIGTEGGAATTRVVCTLKAGE